MLCKKCSQEIPDGSLFCNLCGKKQVSAQRPRNTKSRGNGQGSAYKNASGTWVAERCVMYGGKRSRVRKYGFKTKKDALAYLPQLSFTKEKPNTIRLGEVYEIIKRRDLNNLSSSKQCAYRIAWGRLEQIEMYNVSDITLSLVQELVDDIPGGFYPKRDVKSLLSKMFEYCMIDDYVSKNIARYIAIKKDEEKEKAIYSPEERARIKNSYESGNRFAGYILIMIYCGIRTGELLNIETENIDLEKRIMFGGIKTEKGKNSPIYISDKVYDVVVAEKAHGKKKLYPKDKTTFYDEWEQFKEELKLNSELTPNCARHTCSTLCAEANIPPAVIMEILRHTKYDTSLHYTHIDVDNVLKNLNKI